MSLLNELIQLNESAISGVGKSGYEKLLKLAKKGGVKAFIDEFEDHANSSASMFLTSSQQRKLMKCVADGHEVRVLPFKSEESVYKAEDDLEKKGWKLLGDGDNGGGSVEAIFTKGGLTEAAAKNKKLIAKVKTLAELRMLAKTDKRYEQLAIIAAQNLGDDAKSLEAAMKWLNTNAMETDEKGVVAEVNFCRDLVKEDIAALAEDKPEDKTDAKHEEDTFSVTKLYNVLMSQHFEKWYEKDFTAHVEREPNAKTAFAIKADLHKFLK